MTRQEYIECMQYSREGQSASRAIAMVLKGSSRADRGMMVAASYVLLKAETDTASLDSPEAFCQSVGAGSDRLAFLERHIGDAWQMVAGQRFRYSQNALKSVILFYGDRPASENRRPQSVSRLASRLFRFSGNDEVADICPGGIAFAAEACLDNPSLRFYGTETDASAREIALIRSEVMGIDVAFPHDTDTDACRYRHVFAGFPPALRSGDTVIDRNRIIRRLPGASEAMRSASADWMAVASVLGSLKEGGRGIAVISCDSMQKSVQARRYFIENGYLEAVIALPERIFGSASVPPMLMAVISRGNDRTMLVDATGIYEKGRRFDTLTAEHIERIAYAAEHETQDSRLVPREDIIGNDCDLTPARYLSGNTGTGEGIPLGSVMESVTRGMPMKASELDSLVSEEPTDCQYLMLADIRHGQISTELTYIKGIQESQKRYCLGDRSVVLTKSAPFKVAVAEVPEGRSILASGNLYVIRIDEKKADPYYVKAFLESREGMALLKSIAVGSKTPSIGIEAIKGLPIPCPSLDRQRAVAECYLAREARARRLREELEEAYEEMGRAYEDTEQG